MLVLTPHVIPFILVNMYHHIIIPYIQIMKITHSGECLSFAINLKSFVIFQNYSLTGYVDSGVAFPLQCKTILPVDHIVINSISVRYVSLCLVRCLV